MQFSTPNQLPDQFVFAAKKTKNNLKNTDILDIQNRFFTGNQGQDFKDKKTINLKENNF